MPKTKRDEPAELLRLALTDFDAQIAKLQEVRAQLTALLTGRSAVPAAVEAAATRKQRTLSAAARAKISAAAKARWAKVRKANAKAQKQKPKPTAKKAQPKTKPAKGRAAPAQARKPSSKKGEIW